MFLVISILNEGARASECGSDGGLVGRFGARMVGPAPRAPPGKRAVNVLFLVMCFVSFLLSGDVYLAGVTLSRVYGRNPNY